jgi:DNA mismatch endonuclease (patch repair protein)
MICLGTFEMMTDIFSKSKRSQIMASISNKETKPEVAVRSFLFSKGFRFRKNVKTLIGTPDIVLPKYRVIIFVHGCFWHGHQKCSKSALPTSNTLFWKEKIQTNVTRDKKVHYSLKKSHWKIFIIWECELKNKNSFESTMKKLLRKLECQSYLLNK